MNPPAYASEFPTPAPALILSFEILNFPVTGPPNGMLLIPKDNFGSFNPSVIDNLLFPNFTVLTIFG